MTRNTSGKARRWVASLGVLLLAAAIFFTAAYAPAPVLAGDNAGGYGVPWWTANSGGGQSSSGGYTLRGTIGQPDAAVAAAGGDYALHAGFWRTTPRQPLTIQPLANQTAQAGSSVSLQVVASSPAGGPLQYSASGLPPGLQIDAATGVISGQLAEGSAGVYLVTVTVADDRGASAQAAFTFTVTAPTALDEEPEPDLLPGLYLPFVAN